MNHAENGWIPLDIFAQNHDILYEVGDNVVIGNISFIRPDASPNRIEPVPVFGRGTFDLKIENAQMLVNEEQLLPLISDNLN